MTKSKALEIFEEIYGTPPEFVTASPGRIEFIGNHTDYNGGKVLGAAIDRNVIVAVSRRTDNLMRFKSDGFDGIIEVNSNHAEPLSGKESWVNYPLGVYRMALEKGIKLNGGFDFLAMSDLPSGAGLSSSAALELATLEALLAMTGKTLSNKEKVLVTQKAENKFVGVPCGILDQASSCFGEPDSLVSIDCADIEFSTVPMPEGLKFWIFNSNHKHSLVDSYYADRHRECSKALAIIKDSHPEILHLVDAKVEYLDLIEDETVRARAKHVIEENLRTIEMAKALESKDIERVGELLFASHGSSRDLFENSIPELDCFVDILSRTDGVIGARLTGGGFGGAAIALTQGDFDQDRADKVIATYLETMPEVATPSVIQTATGPGTRVL